MTSRLPPFRSHGYLPTGLYASAESGSVTSFGDRNRVRRRLALRLRRWCDLGRIVGATRSLLDGSFVTAKEFPDDLDAVMLLPADFAEQVERGATAAVELEVMFLTRLPEEIFPAED